MAKLFVFIGALARLLPHPANFTPITAMALFGGSHLSKKQSIVIPLMAMVVSDIGLHFLLGYPLATWSTAFVYVSIAVTAVIGMWYGKNRSSGRFVLASASSIALFFLVTNFGTWLAGGIYPLTWAGFWNCYIAALPFLRNTVLGDAAWITILFGAYRVVSRSLAAKEAGKFSSASSHISA